MKTALILLAGALSAAAQTTPAEHAHHSAQQAKSSYAERSGLTIKALTGEQVAEYRQGKGMGLAIPAEMNGYPGPRHVLDLAGPLALSENQRARMQSVFDAMHGKAVALGEGIIALEQELETAFATGTVTPDRLAELTLSIGKRNGALRAVHLQAHLAARAILTAEQVAKYNALRGYPEGSHRHAR